MNQTIGLEADLTETSNKARLSEIAVQLNSLDNVAIARQNIPAGMRIEHQNDLLQAQQAIPAGHKIALSAIPVGSEIIRYGQVIGVAKIAIAPGDHVHTHNVGLGTPTKNIKSVQSNPSTSQTSNDRSFTFQGYRRPDGRVGTRNYIAVISTVNCSAHAAQQIARAFPADRLKNFPNVDGVIALTHPHGCGVDQDGENYQLLQRTLAGMARNPNVGAFILVGLGCEGNQADALVRNYQLDQVNLVTASPFIIQDLGGVRKTVEAGVEAVARLLPQVNSVNRSEQPLSELKVGIQCGGSDGWSGVTANPVVGLVADKIVQQGGSVVLAETPEIVGAEHLLTLRAESPAIADQLMAQVRWWEEHTQRLGTALDTNRSPGNAAGGLTTIYEKALGAVSKAGSSPLRGVYAYAEPVTTRGLAFMNSPGNDSISVTGQVAGGCNLVLFTTGRGSVFGFKPAPSIKICTNSLTYQRMSEDMDLNAGKVLEGSSLEEVADELFQQVLSVASGQPSKSEALGIGEAEFNPWFLGGVL